MKERLITFKTAKLAKEQGFNEFCDSLYKDENTLYRDCHEYNPSIKYYNEDYKESIHNPNWYLKEACSAPTQSLLQKWLREKHGVHITVWFSKVEKNFNLEVYLDTAEDEVDIIYEGAYEQALEKGLQEALKLIEYGKN